jgi:hypothetical protein
MHDLERTGHQTSMKLQEIELQKRQLNEREREVKRKQEEVTAQRHKEQKILNEQKQNLATEEKKIRNMQQHLHKEFSLPELWSSTERPPNGVRAIPVQSSSDMFNLLQNFLVSDCIGRGGRDQQIPGSYSRLSLRCAWRVENPDVWRTYSAGKKRVMGVRAQGERIPRLHCALDEASCKIGELDASINEVRLLHGTKPGVLESLLRNGMNERFSGTR